MQEEGVVHTGTFQGPRLSVEAEYASTTVDRRIVDWRTVDWSGSDGHEERAGGCVRQEESDELNSNGAAGGDVQKPGWPVPNSRVPSGRGRTMPRDEYHCHLTHRYVACWSWQKGSEVIEVYYAGSREDAPY